MKSTFPSSYKLSDKVASSLAKRRLVGFIPIYIIFLLSRVILGFFKVEFLGSPFNTAWVVGLVAIPFVFWYMHHYWKGEYLNNWELLLDTDGVTLKGAETVTIPYTDIRETYWDKRFFNIVALEDTIEIPKEMEEIQQVIQLIKDKQG